MRHRSDPGKKGWFGLSRRGILAISWASFLTSIFGPAFANVRFLFPNVVYEPPTRIKAGKAGDYAPGSATFIPEQRVFLLREERGFRCISAVCTHLRCTVDPFGPPDRDHPEGHSHCPCHGSVFALKDGRVLQGPAPSPLDFYQVGLGPDGRIVIETSRRVDPGVYLQA
jgi:cytochrome b6-f complex iron-sulfur subunit